MRRSGSTEGRRSRRSLALLPAGLLLVLGMMSAAGISLSSSAVAISTSQQVQVTASVGADVHASNSCSGSITQSTPMVTTDAADDIGQCGITFGTNSGSTGATLQLIDANAGNPFLCARAGINYTGACANAATEAFADNMSAAQSWAAFNVNDGAHDGKAAAAVISATGNTAQANWGVGTGTNGSGEQWNPVPAGAGTVVCLQASVGSDATCTLKFAANPVGGQTNPGGANNYLARADFTITAT